MNRLGSSRGIAADRGWRPAEWSGRALILGAVAFWWGLIVVPRLISMAFPELLSLDAIPRHLDPDSEGNLANAVSAIFLLITALLAFAMVRQAHYARSYWDTKGGWTVQYRQTYNHIRPHSSLGYRPPAPAAILPAEPVLMPAGLVAVAIDQQGVRLGQRRSPATTWGYGDLEQWPRDLGEVSAFGVECTGSYGAGFSRYLTGRGYTVVEVNRPDRSVRYRKGKSDPTDAESAARAVLAGVADATPKSGEGEVEMIRMLKSAKDSAIKARTQTVNQMKALVVTAPAQLRETLDGLTTAALATRCKSFRPGRLKDPAAAAKYALRSLARRYRQLGKEIQDLQAELARLIRTTAPALVGVFGVGPDTAATLLIAAGGNPQRLRSEAAFASLCGVNPIPASSGKTNRHRLNRGGHRRANAALYRIVLVRLRYDRRTKAYMHRRTGEGLSKSEIIRCLKRYVAREVFSVIQNSAELVRRAA